MNNCTGIRCIMQTGTVDPATCDCVSRCPQATPPTTNGPTVYELQILVNQVTIMGALAVIFPEQGDQEILQNLMQSARNTQALVFGVTPKEEE